MFKRKEIRILFAISNLTYGGIQTQALTLAKEYQKKGAKIYFFWTSKWEDDFVNNELLRNNFKLIDGRFLNDKFWSKHSWRLQRYIPMIKTVFLMRSLRIDYIIPYQNSLSYFFGAIHPYTGAKRTIFHIRNTVQENSPKENWHFKLALNNKPTIVTNSKHALLKFQLIYGDLYTLDIRSIYNGIKIRKIDTSVNWKRYFEVDNSEFIVSAIANFFNEKDYITVFKSWRDFIKITDSNSILLIAGDEGNKGMMDFYKKTVTELGILDYVKFLGRTPYNIELLSITNCNILSTKNEGLPNCVIETLGMGKPFIGTNVDGVREVVGKSYPMPLFDVGDFMGMTSILVNLYDEKYEISEIESYSFERFKQFMPERLIHDYSEIIII
jgi:glycosyltransferase involved in cell wall biosynthesis